jgi:CRP-like cAMP-binding protein
MYYVLSSGQAEVLAQTQGQEECVAVLRSGDSFDETASPYETVALYTRTPARFFCIDATTAHDVLGQHYEETGTH